jgi:hypothetical protein
MNIGAGKDSELTLPPLDCTIANNLVWSSREQLITYTDTPLNMKYEGNIFFGSTLGITKPAGIKIIDPTMIFPTDSVWKLTASSPAIDSAVGTYSFVTTDMDGQPRVAPFDIGADEFSNAASTQRPIKKTEVGVSAVVTKVERSNSSMTPVSFAVIRNYPNPFNPATTVEFSIPETDDCVLKIYNGIGEEIETLFERRAEGNKLYQIQFNASQLATGLYYAELRYGTHSTAHKMLLIK